MTLAEALHLQGRLSESVTVFGELPAELNNDSKALEMYGRLSAARNQHLRSTRTFQQAIDLGSTKPGELWYWSGVSALERRDFSSASTALDRAHASGELPALVQDAHEKLDRQTSPLFSLPARIFGDSNDLSVRQTGVRGQIWPSLAVPLFGEVVVGEVSQHETRHTRQRAVIGVADAFVAPALTLGLEAGAERYDRGSLFVGRGAATFTHEDTSLVTVEVQRGTFWSAHDRRNPREFNRVVDLAGLGPGMRVTRLQGTTDTVLAPGRRLRAEGGADRYGDGNVRGFAYGHYEMVTTARQGRWTAFAPNLYWESYRRDSPLYFSPSSYVALGGLLHTIRSTPGWRVELEANPTATWYRSDLGFALHGVVDAARTWERATLGAGAFFFYDQRQQYWSYRIAGQFDLRLGR